MELLLEWRASNLALQVFILHSRGHIYSHMLTKVVSESAPGGERKWNVQAAYSIWMFTLLLYLYPILLVLRKSGVSIGSMAIRIGFWQSFRNKLV